MTNGQVLTFKYAESFAPHYLYRGAVDSHNPIRNDGKEKLQVGLKNARITHEWEIRVLVFL